MLTLKGPAAALALAVTIASATPAMAEWTTQNSADVAAINNLLGRYMHALDTANPEAYSMVFAPDGEMGTGNMAEKGRDHLKKYVVDLRKQWALPNDGKEHWGRTRHIFYNLHIDEIDDTHAAGGTYWQTLIGDAQTGTWRPLATGTSKETYTKIDGEWYIQTRQVTGDPKPVATAGGEH
jgi:hypothetical protein